MFRLLDETIGDKILRGVEAAAQGIFGVSAKDLTVPQAAFIAGLPQSPIVYSPYAADGSLKSKENLELGWRVPKTFCSICTGREPCRKKDYETYAQYDLTKRLHGSRWHRENTA